MWPPNYRRSSVPVLVGPIAGGTVWAGWTVLYNGIYSDERGVSSVIYNVMHHPTETLVSVAILCFGIIGVFNGLLTGIGVYRWRGRAPGGAVLGLIIAQIEYVAIVIGFFSVLLVNASVSDHAPQSLGDAVLGFLGVLFWGLVFYVGYLPFSFLPSLLTGFITGASASLEFTKKEA